MTLTALPPVANDPAWTVSTHHCKPCTIISVSYPPTLFPTTEHVVSHKALQTLAYSEVYAPNFCCCYIRHFRAGHTQAHGLVGTCVCGLNKDSATEQFSRAQSRSKSKVNSSQVISWASNAPVHGSCIQHVDSVKVGSPPIAHQSIIP